MFFKFEESLNIVINLWLGLRMKLLCVKYEES